MALRPVLADDERHHPPGDEPLWNESWYFDFVDGGGRVGGYVRVGLYPNLGVVWYWAALAGADRRLVTVVDHAVPLPRREGSLELRSEGLWADHCRNESLEHWNLGLEAFGVSLDDPADAYGDLRGDRTPLGLDLEWETEGEPYRYPPGLDRYEIPCRVHGIVLVGDEELHVDGPGQRDHSWGVRDWWLMGWLWSAWRRGDGAAVHAMTTVPHALSAGYRQRPGDAHELEVVHVEEPGGPAGIPPWVEITTDDAVARAEPIAWAPVLLEGPDGQRARFPRAMCRFVADDGDVGLGWLELGQPEDPAIPPG